MHKKFDRLISADQAKELIRKTLTVPLESEKINLGDSLKRMLIADIVAPRNSPALPRSAMDGYAVRSSDIAGVSKEEPAFLEDIGEVLIGETPQVYSGEKICVKIPTGGSVPESFDCVVPVEFTAEHDGQIEITEHFAAGANIDPIGSDYREGEILLNKGTVIRSKDVSVIASLGRSDIDVLKKIRVGIAPTGNELMPAGFMPTPSKIYDSNGWGIKAVLDETNLFAARHYGILKDNMEEISGGLRNMLLENDLVITTGGTSAGEKDMVYRVLSESEPGIVFHGISTKPGMPTLFSVSGEKTVIGLPGPPVSAMMILYEIFLPILFEKVGMSGIRIRMHARLAEDARLSRGKLNLIPVSLRDEGELLAYPLPGGSGAVTRLARAQGYFSHPGDSDHISAGTRVDVVPFSVMPM